MRDHPCGGLSDAARVVWLSAPCDRSIPPPRLSKTLGIGPMVDFGIGRYTRAKVETLGVTREGDIQNTALHQWLTLGVRLVVLP